MLEFSTINELFLEMSHKGSKTVAQWKDGGEWKPITSQQIYGRVRATVALLQSWGVQPGDRVAMVCENRWEWPVLDFAILGMGAVSVPLYQTLTPEQMGYVLRDSGSRAFFLSTKQQYKKLKEAGELPALEHVCVLDDGEFDGAVLFSEVMKGAAELESVDDGFDSLVKQVKPEDLATIVYTSGTTGDPKGVMLTHQNLAQNLKHSTDGLYIDEKDSSISFLPLSHCLARHLDYAIYGNGGQIAYLPKFDDLIGATKAVKPTIFLAVPRVFEKVRQGTESKPKGFRKTIFNWALGVGKSNRKTVMEGKEPGSPLWKLANKLVYTKLREALGGNVRLFVSGGAPLGVDSTNWFLDMNVRIFEGYGLTETSPVLSRNTFDAYRAGTVGEIIPNIEIRTAADGEIEVKGTSVFKGYWRREEDTKKEFTEDGWFKTGDVGKLDDNFLSITDRKKELLKTSGGKYIAPQPIEGKLKADGMISNAALIGDNRKYASVLISPNLPALTQWAGQNGVSGEPAAIVKDPKVQKMYEAIVKKVNSGLEHHETIKKLVVVPEEWNVDSGELTPSMKLKRRVIVEKYKNEIAGMYREAGGE
jgi:long-chain acyl-CoA synthetase